MNTDIIIAKNNTPVLWTASNGVPLPKSAELEKVLSYNLQLKNRDIIVIINNCANGNYEMASEYVWERAVRLLRDRVFSLGIEFVGEMIGLSDDAYIRELPSFEVINLAAELGFINSTGKMRLSQANEIVQHYRELQIEDEMPKNEAHIFIREQL